MTSRRWPFSTFLLAPCWIWSVMNLSVPEEPAKWAAVDTQFGGSNGKYADYQQHQQTIDRALAIQAEIGAAVVVLPESALGLWTPTIERLWTRGLEGSEVTVYGGAVIVNETGYDNVMLELTEQGASVRYRQRMPVPVSMWQPWLGLHSAPAGARADFFANPVVLVRGYRVATLLCYEQLLVWPILQSMLQQPDVIVAPVNGWWTSGTEIVAVQHATAEAWARLFGLPLAVAINL
jgi:apolipoprotein N-acyltransferase